MVRILHSSFAGSYYQECTIVDHVKFDPVKHGSDLNKVMIAFGYSKAEDHPHFDKDGVIVSYYDDVLGESVEQWVEFSRIETMRDGSGLARFNKVD